MNPDLFGRDLERKPEVLSALAEELRREDPWAGSGLTRGSHILLLGMGSSHFANGVAAARLRARGVWAVAELASSDLLPPAGPGLVVVAVSASGGSAETIDAVRRYEGRCPVIAVTNVDDSPITRDATGVVPMRAEAELGGVACRSFQHTVALLLALESSLFGGVDVAALVSAAAVASADLLDRRESWLPGLRAAVIGPDGTHVAAPARRFGSAQQSALMLREGPRLPAVACETGDWSHVDVYLTKTTDYRLLLLGGSRWEPELLRWVSERGSTLVMVGSDAPAAAQTIRYRHDDEDDVRLLAEVLVAEILAWAMWS